MPYATQQDLVDRFGEDELIQLTDRATPPAGAIDATVVAKALLDAENLIDGHLLAANYAMPLSAVPDLVRKLACDCARYYLHKDAATETVRKNFEDAPTEAVRKGFEDAMRQLERIAAGKLKLPIANAPAPTGSDEVMVEGPERIFTPENLEDY